MFFTIFIQSTKVFKYFKIIFEISKLCSKIRINVRKFEIIFKSLKYCYKLLKIIKFNE